ncbi:MAG: hypothetical protein FJZ97_06465 [Chloroflexi bacterium]|nr:hypothetical protein [Chloroflexota bacterium]
MPSDPIRPTRSRRLVPACSVFLVLLGLYTLTFQGDFRVDDEHILAARAQSLALWGRLEQPQVFGNQRERELQAMGAAATQIEPGQAVLGAGLYRLAIGLGWGGAQTMLLQNALLTAAAGAVIVLAAGALGFAQATGVAVGLLFGTGTMAWPYATTYFRDPLVMFGAVLSLLGWVQISHPAGRPARSGWVILLFGLVIAITAKNAALVLLPAIAAMLPPVLRRASPASRRRWVVGLAGATLVIVFLLLVPKPEELARFTLAYYVSIARHFLSGWSAATLIEGTLGPFVSPARSLLLFSPVLVLLAGVPRRWWRQEGVVAGAVVLTAIGLALAQVLFYRQQWAGAVGWGPRFMLPALPGLMLLTAPAVERLSGRAAGRVVLVAVGILGCVLQLASVLVPWQAAYESIRTLGLEPYVYTGAWDARRWLPFHQLPLLMSPGTWSTAWLRIARLGFGDWVLPAGLSMAATLAGLLLLRAKRAGVATGACVLAALVVLGCAASSARSDPAWYARSSRLGEAIAYVEAGIGDGDVLLVDAYGTPAWYRAMNEWSSPARWYSLPFEIPGTQAGWAPGPQADVASLFEELLAGGVRLWLLTSSDAPDFLARNERTWLEAHARLVTARSFSEGSLQVDVLSFESN